MKGLYQRKNIPTVLETIPVLQQAGLKISDQQVRQGIERVVTNTGLFRTLANPFQPAIDHLRHGSQYRWPDRDHPTIKNSAGIESFILSSVWLVTKTSTAYYISFLRMRCIISAKASIPRAMPEQQLAQKQNKAGLQGPNHPLSQQLTKQPGKLPPLRDMIYIGGSTFVVAEVI